MSRTAQSALRNVRRTRTISQAELAQLADMSQAVLSKAERGVITLRPDIQERLAAILGTSRADLFPDVVSG